MTPSACPTCGARALQPFYEVRGVPVHNVLLMPTRAAATEVQRGDILLAVCTECGFVTNQHFEESLLEFEDGYEATQAFSPTFNAFHRELAEQLIESYALRGKRILEIGCGNGEFLALLCEMGSNIGVGYDPVHDPRRAALPASGSVRYVPSYFTATCRDDVGDFVCCKMTLEHVAAPARFVRMVREAIGERTDARVFFQVPDAERILREVAFWDVYYEHPSYFCAASLRRAFRDQGFAVERTWTAYGDQYLMIEARPGPARPGGRNGRSPAGPARIVELARQFAEDAQARVSGWRMLLSDHRAAGPGVVLWGAGSKAVSFLSALQCDNAVDYCIDVNPHKDGTFLPGSGHRIYHPDTLPSRPGLVVVMNPIYREEIENDLASRGFQAQVVDLASDPRLALQTG